MNQKKRELQQNELADALGTKLEKLKPHIPKIAMFSAVGILAIIAIAFWLNTRKTINESQWREYFVSSRFADARGWDTVAEIFPGTTVGNLALVNAGDSDFTTGSRQIVSNRAEYSAKLRKAAEDYEAVVQSSKARKFEKLRATLALGYTYEALGRFDEAREMYEAVSSEHADTPEGELASKCLDRINDPELVAIYAAFKDWVPAPDEAAPGSLGTDPMLPLRPDISMPKEMPQAPDFDPTPETPTGEPNPAEGAEQPDDGGEENADEAATESQTGESGDENEGGEGGSSDNNR